MTPPAPSTDAQSERDEAGHSSRRRVPQRLTALRARFEGSWVGDLDTRLKALDVGNAVVLFGSALLLSVLPLLVLLSSLADQRIDDDLSRHIGLNHQGAVIIEGLFRKSPTHSAGPIVLGLITTFVGTVTVVHSLQGIYEQVFDQPHRGWRDLPRLLVWVAVLLAVLTAAGLYDHPVRSAAGPVVRGLLSFVVVTGFFWWTIHFLLGGGLPWRELIRPAIATSLLWVGLAVFSSIYFSSAIISEHRLFGLLGVVFILLVWFIAVGAVIIAGAICGAVWQARRRRGAIPAGPAKTGARLPHPDRVMKT